MILTTILLLVGTRRLRDGDARTGDGKPSRVSRVRRRERESYAGAQAGPGGVGRVVRNGINCTQKTP